MCLHTLALSVLIQLFVRFRLLRVVVYSFENPINCNLLPFPSMVTFFAHPNGTVIIIVGDSFEENLFYDYWESI